MRKGLLYILFALLLAVPNFLNIHLQTPAEKGFDWEEFDVSLANHLRSIPQLKSYTDSILLSKQIAKGSLKHAEILAKTLRKRFYHGYAYYSLRENWIAAVCGKLFWENLGAIVIPEDLMHYPMAACSQQEIVLMKLFTMNGIDYRKILFNHHFAAEARINKAWYYFDTNLEPNFPNKKRESIATFLDRNQMKEIYAGRLDVNKLDSILGAPKYGAINQYPAPRARLFHQVTQFFSHWFWLIFLIAGCIKLFKAKKLLNN